MTTKPMDEALAWQMLVGRKATDRFVYGVTTTGVVCRPGCGSRLPRRENVRFFASLEGARAAGFRACLRCRPDAVAGPEPVARMCALLERAVDRAVTLEELGRLIGRSPFTAQKMFRAAMGVTPAGYQRALRGRGLRAGLREGATVTEAIYGAGYGASSRAYEAGALGMTPGRFKAGGKAERIGFAVAECAEAVMGWLIVGATERGICWVALADTAEEAEAELRAEFPAAELVPDGGLGELVVGVMRAVAGEAVGGLPVDLRGTAFQLKVWRALTEIPAGETRSYSQLAGELGMPRATRAVARACATNRVAVVVPCHRVVGASGALTGYRWGVERKRRLLEGEKQG
jgi:AraC family transcriptional regulator of adaptative response/methylated-DNA-[protein]-cysteine methyltransferase